MRFEETWLEYRGCEEVVSNGWASDSFDGSSLSLKSKLNPCILALNRWGSNRIGNYRRRIQAIEAKVKQAIQNIQHMAVNSELMGAEAKLDQLLLEEEIFWKQRSREH